jgi:hypothetical protein
MQLQCRSLLFLGLEIMPRYFTAAFLVAFAWSGSSVQGQITNVSNNQSIPAPGRGHEYIGTLSDIVSPSNGSLSLRIPLPSAKGRGISLPLQISYNSNGIIQVTSTVGSNGNNQGWNGGLLLGANLDSRFLEQGGWGIGLPLFSVTEVKIPGNNYTYPSATCPIYTGFVFTDPSGSRHAMNLALPNYSICNSTGVANGYSMNANYTSYDGSYFRLDHKCKRYGDQ